MEPQDKNVVNSVTASGANAPSRRFLKTLVPVPWDQTLPSMAISQAIRSHRRHWAALKDMPEQAGQLSTCPSCAWADLSFPESEVEESLPRWFWNMLPQMNF